MKPALHDPVRGADESQAAYRARRRKSAELVRELRAGVPQPQRYVRGRSRFIHLEPSVNPERNAQRRVTRALGARQAKKAAKAARRPDALRAAIGAQP